MVSYLPFYYLNNDDIGNTGFIFHILLFTGTSSGHQDFLTLGSLTCPIYSQDGKLGDSINRKISIMLHASSQAATSPCHARFSTILTQTLHYMRAENPVVGKESNFMFQNLFSRYALILPRR